MSIILHIVGYLFITTLLWGCSLDLFMIFMGLTPTEHGKMDYGFVIIFSIINFCIYYGLFCSMLGETEIITTAHIIGFIVAFIWMLFWSKILSNIPRTYY